MCKLTSGNKASKAASPESVSTIRKDSSTAPLPGVAGGEGAGPPASSRRLGKSVGDGPTTVSAKAWGVGGERCIVRAALPLVQALFRALPVVSRNHSPREAVRGLDILPCRARSNFFSRFPQMCSLQAAFWGLPMPCTCRVAASKSQGRPGEASLSRSSRQGAH